MKKNNLFIAILLLMGVMVNAQSTGEQRPPKPPSVEEHLNRVASELDKQLGLPADKKEKVLAVYKTFFAEMEKHRKEGMNEPPPPPPPPVDKATADKLSGERDAKIKLLLTDDQYKKYVELEQAMRPRNMKHRDTPCAK